MPIAPSFQDLVIQGESELLALRPDLALNEGDVTEADLHAAAAMADACIRYSALALRETFIDSAEGDALTALVYDHLGLVRQAASSAQVTLTFARTSGGGAGSIPSGTVVATLFDANGKQVRFTTNSATSVGAGNNGPFSVVATASVAGRSGNVASATITKVVDSLFDTFTVTNAALAAGGNDEESDEELKRRAKTFFQTLRRGTIAALEYGALQVASVRVAVASEDLDSGIVTLLVGDSDGNSTAQMIADVEAEEENWRAAGTLLNVGGSSRVLVTFDATLTVRDGFDLSSATTTLAAAITARSEKLLPGHTLFLDAFGAAIINSFPDDIFSVEFTRVGVAGVDLTTPANVPATAAQVNRIDTYSLIAVVE